MEHQRIHKRIALAAALLGAFVLAAAASGAEKVANFTADQVTIGPDGKTLATSRISVLGDTKYRIDGIMRESGNDIVSIMRRDLKKNWMLNLTKKTYVEQVFDEKELEKLAGSVKSSQSEKILGEESVSGYPCTKKEIVSEFQVMGMKQKSRMLVWQSPRFDMPLRTRGEDGHLTELRNIKEGAPPAALFELPAGFTKVAGMMELIGEQDAADEEEEAPPAAGKAGAPKLPPGVKLPPGLKLPAPKP